jgi:hypothetical protein
MELSDIPNYIPHYTDIEKKLMRAIRKHDTETLLRLVENTPEVTNYLLDIFPPLDPEDLIRTMLPSRRLMEILLFHYPPLPLNVTQRLDRGEKERYRRRLIEVLGYIPRGIPLKE